MLTHSSEVSEEELKTLIAAWKLPVSAETLVSYASVLRKHRLEDVRVALRQLVDEANARPRKTVPHVSFIVDRVRQAYRRRVAKTLGEPVRGTTQGWVKSQSRAVTRP